MGCSCSITDDFAEGCTVGSETHPTARKEHRCCECWRVIEKGEEYEKYKGCWEGSWSTYKTCADCASVRDAMFCSWEYGRMWERLHETLQEDPEPPSSSCMMAMTKPGRDRVCDRLEQIWEEMDDER